MADLEILFRKKTQATVGVVTLDASLSENHSKSNEVTMHPVEDGSDVTDHIRVMPETLEISGIVSNHPIAFLGPLAAPNPVTTNNASISDRVGAAYEALRLQMDRGETVDVVTSLRKYSDMAITKMDVTRDATTGNSLAVNMSLQQIFKAKIVEQAPEPVKAGAQKKSDQGNKGTKEATVAQAAKADGVLRQTIGALTSGTKELFGSFSL